ncbi:glycosyltransferase family 4 protein [Rubrivirga sp.]|uniref:glycosyltransferase family 4 protein n=1 Tax=Rubrivirga sp. TaxID=1885344 RepID=UPI003C767820
MANSSLRLLALVTDAYGGRGGIAEFNRQTLGAVASHPRIGRIEVVARLAAERVEGMPEGVVVDEASLRGAGPYVRSALGSGFRADGVLCGHLHLIPLAATIAVARRIPLLLVLHGIEAWEPRRGIRSAALGLALPRVDHVAAVSTTTLERFSSWAPVHRAQRSVVPNTFAPGPFSPGPAPEALRRKYGLAGRAVVLTLGRLAGLERRKGFDVVLEALPEIARRVPNVVYVIAGDGPDRARLEAKAARLGVADRVVFTGYVDEADKPGMYRVADAFAMPSRGEGFGIVLLEAMASGVPVVASMADGSREAVLDGRLGPTVDPEDLDAVADAVVSALARPKQVPDGLDHFSHHRFVDR